MIYKYVSILHLFIISLYGLAVIYMILECFVYRGTRILIILLGNLEMFNQEVS